MDEVMKNQLELVIDMIKKDRDKQIEVLANEIFKKFYETYNYNMKYVNGAQHILELLLRGMNEGRVIEIKNNDNIDSNNGDINNNKIVIIKEIINVLAKESLFYFNVMKKHPFNSIEYAISKAKVNLIKQLIEKVSEL